MSENIKKMKKEDGEVKPKISEKNLAVVITAAVLAVILITTAVISLVDAIQNDVWFDYLTSDLDDYIEFTEDYKSFKVNVDIAKAHDIDIDVTILNMLYQDRGDALYGGSPVTSAITITEGDTANIWYRGYILDPDGEKLYLDGMSNFTGSSAYALGIGSNGFVPGFELNMIGKNTGDYSKFEKITTGALSDDMAVYVSYSVTNEKDSTKKDTKSNIRIDLSEDLDATWGEGFKESLMKLAIGGTKTDIKVTKDSKEYTYFDMVVNFALNCESNPMLIECYFPYDYSNNTDLRNETAYFEVYVDGVVVYDTPEFNDEYLTKKIEDEEINLTLEELNEYEGATLVEKYKSFAKKTMDDIYDSSYESLVESAVWAHYSKIVKVKKYPGIKVEEVYNTFIDEISAQYLSSGGQAYDSTTGSYKTYDSLEKYIPAYLGLSSTADWQAYLVETAKNTVKERMIMYYILKDQGLLPTKDEYNKLLSDVHQEYADEYLAQYLEYVGKTEEDYTKEEYAELVEDCRNDVLSFYTDEFYKTQVYYRIVAEAFVKWPEVSTLDDRRAYPFDK